MCSQLFAFEVYVAEVQLLLGKRSGEIGVCCSSLTMIPEAALPPV